jgi:hypothetical protein
LIAVLSWLLLAFLQVLRQFVIFATAASASTNDTCAAQGAIGTTTKRHELHLDIVMHAGLQAGPWPGPGIAIN